MWVFVYSYDLQKNDLLKSNAMCRGKKSTIIPVIVMSGIIIFSCSQVQHTLSVVSFSDSLNAEGASSDSIYLSWTMPVEHMGLNSFTIYRGDMQIAVTESYEYTDIGLAENTEYTYRVCGSEGSREIACTKEAAARTYRQGKTFYVDPATGSMENDGSFDAPWSTMEDVIQHDLVERRVIAEYPYVDGVSFEVANPGAPVKGGDTIVLRSGFHGEIWLRGCYLDKYLTVRAQDGHTPVLSRVMLSAASRWRIQGLTVTQEAASEYEPVTLAVFESHGWHGPAHHMIIEDCDVYSVSDASSWDAGDWDSLSCSGISSSGDYVRVVGNRCRNINFGISISGDRSVVRNNLVENFCGDGMRGNANDLLFEYNTVKNCYKVNDNHDDGFQSFSVNGAPPRERVVLRGNMIINDDDYNREMAGPLQGIGCFDGLYINWIVENNLVIVDHWHGISLYGALNCIIRNNTVVNPYGNERPPWIMVTSHKDGRKSRGCVIRNNISESINYSSDELVDHNYLSTRDYSIFADPAAFDFHLKGSAQQVIDAGTMDLAPLHDIEGTRRPRGNACDPGAYEYY